MAGSVTEVLDVLGRVAAGEGHLWGWCVGLAARRRVVHQGLAAAGEVGAWDEFTAIDAALAAPAVGRAVAAWAELAHGDGPQAARLVTHARGLVATAAVAAALQRDAPDEGLRWARAAVELLHPEVDPTRTWPTAGRLAARAGRLLPPAECGLAWYWVQCHLASPQRPAVGPAVSLPVAAWQPVGGALIFDLVLQRLPAASGLLVHPDLALLPLAPDLLATLEAARAVCRGGVAWCLEPRGGGETERLSGTSLGAAAAVGCQALRAGWTPDPHCLIVAQVAGEALQPVEHEAEKLDAAVGLGLDRAVVAADSAVLAGGEASFESRRPLLLRGAATVREAARLAHRGAGRRRRRLLLAAVVCGLCWWQGWAGLPADFRLHRSYRLVFASDRDNASNNYDLWLCDDQGGRLRRLTRDPAPELCPAWSPDGRQIAFNRVEGGHDSNLWVIDRHGGHARRLTDSPAYDGNPSWSPDGRWLLFQSGRGYLPTDPAKLARLRTDPRASGPWKTRYDIYLLPAAGGEARRLVSHPTQDESPRWAPQGNLAVCQSFRRLVPSPAGMQVFWDCYLFEPHGPPDQERRVPVPLDRPDCQVSEPAWAPDGNSLVLTVGQELWIYRTDGYGTRRLLASSDTDHQADWSPNGRQIVFTRDVNGQQSDLWLVGADGRGQRNLTHHPASDMTAAWCPVAR